MNTQAFRCFHFPPVRAIALAMAACAVAPAAYAAQQLTNGSFDTAGGAGWSKAATWTDDPFATAGEVDLNMTNWPGSALKIIWQDLNIENVSGLAGTASIQIKKTFGPDGASTVVYLDYVDGAGAPQRLELLRPDNGTVNAPPYGSYFRAPFTVPAGARRITGFSVDRTYFGGFQVLEFGLDLPVPVAMITSPNTGATLAGGSSIPLMAAVDASGASVSKLEFYANGTLIGTGQPGFFGEWTFPDGSHLSVMHANVDGVMLDYNPIGGESMYMMHGVFVSPFNFEGSYIHWPAAGGEASGNAGVEFSYAANKTLNASIFAMSPLGMRTLTGGTNGADNLEFNFSWPNAAPGNYALTARAYYGADLYVTSAPVNITVGSQTAIPKLAIQRVSATEVELSWMDVGGTWQLEQQAGLAAANWTTLAGTPVLNGGRYSLKVAMSGPTRFYRLRSP